uniref:Uncharacterized protein n=1 Tax=Anguilla anguilla TaxID=7936 RepID=A0A0E9VR50_ANGAN
MLALSPSMLQKNSKIASTSHIKLPAKKCYNTMH